MSIVCASITPFYRLWRTSTCATTLSTKPITQWRAHRMKQRKTMCCEASLMTLRFPSNRLRCIAIMVYRHVIRHFYAGYVHRLQEKDIRIIFGYFYEDKATRVLCQVLNFPHCFNFILFPPPPLFPNFPPSQSLTLSSITFFSTLLSSFTLNPPPFLPLLSLHPSSYSPLSILCLFLLFTHPSLSPLICSSLPTPRLITWA